MKKTLVFGASLKPERYSNMVIRRLRGHSVPTVAFGLRAGEVMDVLIQNTLVDIKDIDTVTLYMNPKRQKDYYNDIIDLGPRRVIFNPNTENPEFYDLLKENNIEVEVACTLVLLGTDQY